MLVPALPLELRVFERLLSRAGEVGVLSVDFSIAAQRFFPVSPASEEALATLRRKARGHPGASSGERAAWDILKNFQEATAVDFASSLVRLDSEGRSAVATIVVDLATGRTGLIELG